MPPRMKLLKLFDNHVNSIFVSFVDSQATCVQMETVSSKLVPEKKFFSEVKVQFDIIVKGSFQNSSSLRARTFNRDVDHSWMKQSS